MFLARVDIPKVACPSELTKGRDSGVRNGSSPSRGHSIVLIVFWIEYDCDKTGRGMGAKKGKKPVLPSVLGFTDPHASTILLEIHVCECSAKRDHTGPPQPFKFS